MRRRDFTILIAGATAWPLAVVAQQSVSMRRVGVLLSGAEDDPEMKVWAAALQQGLQSLGWQIGRDLQIDYRWNASGPERAQADVQELLSRRPEVIVAVSVSAARAAENATRTVPIVFTGVSEPVTLGLVASLPRPGGNITGFTNLEPGIGAKWLELLKEIAPNISLAGFLFNPNSTPVTPLFYKSIEAAAAKTTVNTAMIPVSQPAEIEVSLAKFGAEPDFGLVVQPDTYLTFHRDLILAAAVRYRFPAIYPFDFYSKAGGLMSYGPDIADELRRAAGYVDRILRGERPADLPVQQPVKFEFIVNKKTAETLGLTVPPTLLAIADEVIE